MRSSLKLAALVAGLLVVPLGSVAGASVITPSLTNVVRTSDWVQPSPDPMGLAYKPKTNTIFVVDSEVEETPLWGNVNVWEMTRAGAVVSAGRTTRYSIEPTDIAFSPVTGRFFISDDDLDRVFNVSPGKDGKLGNRDDRQISFSTAAFGSHDAEGIGFGAGSVWITDGVGQFVFRMNPGTNGVFDGVAPEGDDVVSHFSTTTLGLPNNDPEDIVFDPASKHLFIVSRFDKVVVETTKAGNLINTFDLSSSQILQPAGVVLAPGTDGSVRSLFVADRGYDNNLHPNENDGRIFEFKRA